VEVQFHTVLISRLDESDRSALSPGSSTMISVMTRYQAGWIESLQFNFWQGQQTCSSKSVQTSSKAPPAPFSEPSRVYSWPHNSTQCQGKNVWSRVLFVLPEEQSCYMLKIKHISKGDTKLHHGLMFVVIDKCKIHFINQATSNYYVKFT